MLNYINPFSEDFILGGVLDFLSNILSYINPFNENFLGYKLINLLSDLLKSLFVPSQESISNLSDTVSSRFSFIDTIKKSVNYLKDTLFNNSSSSRNTYGAANTNIPKFSIDLGATKYTSATTVYIDFAWYEPFKPYGDFIITVFCYVSFLWRIFVRLPSIISGTAGAAEVIEKRSDFK